MALLGDASEGKRKRKSPGVDSPAELGAVDVEMMGPRSRKQVNYKVDAFGCAALVLAH